MTDFFIHYINQNIWMVFSPFSNSTKFAVKNEHNLHKYVSQGLWEIDSLWIEFWIFVINSTQFKSEVSVITYKAIKLT